MLTLIAVVVVLAIAAVLALAAKRPDTCTIRRTTRVEAPPERIFPLIENLRDNARWLPYYMKDPAMKCTYAGPERGPGAQVDFAGNKDVGSGRVTITGTAPPGRVTMRLQMFKPFAADNVVEFTLAAVGSATDVTWAMEGRMPFPAKVVQLFIDTERMVGRDFETGLANLKTLSET